MRGQEQDLHPGNVSHTKWKRFFSIGFISVSEDSIITPNDLNLNCFFQLAFSATSTTIISGAMAERLYLSG